MYNIFGFYKFKKITNLKKKKKILDNYLKQENFRGTIILSTEGVNGTISFKIERYISIRIFHPYVCKYEKCYAVEQANDKLV